MVARTLDALAPLPTQPTATVPKAGSSLARSLETPATHNVETTEPTLAYLLPPATTHDEPTQPAPTSQDTPAIQRAPEPEPAPAAPASPAATPTPPPPETEELVKKLFDPLLRRLKTELRLDRERRGALTDRSH
ncbi:hypothetical protein [Amycolatopsis solani]|uniref:hypothetical protein n=1 Tax=Amycolatopsis solani TaxID=3028615 RepID=UPI0025B1CD4D|nr:hypothetical protein [Amycolatopsis sp. MEP2-6]